MREPILKALILTVGLLFAALPVTPFQIQASAAERSSIAERRSSAKPSGTNFLTIEGVGMYKFDCAKVETCRPEIFAERGFSVFDALVYVAEKNGLALKHHFAPELDTHVIDSLQGRTGWWYYAHYDGGNRESNAHRMDYFPYKNKMAIGFMPLAPAKLGDDHGYLPAGGRALERKQGAGHHPARVDQGIDHEPGFS